MARLSQCNAESFYRGEAGRKYFSRFPSPRSDILSRCFTAKVGRWIVPEDRVFEYGVGSGRNLLPLAVAERAGYDVSEHARTAAREAGLYIYDAIDRIPCQHWSLVICHHVLEHVPSPLDTLQRLRELLSPQGKLILTVPLEGQARRVKPKNQDPDHHLYCWNPTTLRNLVECAGFATRDIQVRIAARQDIFAPVAHYSWTAFTLLVWGAGMILRRGEVTIVAALE